MNQPRETFYSLPEVWDFCLEKIYNKEEYISGLLSIFGEKGVTKKSFLLDAGCGSGFPTLDLVERGYRVIATDKSSEMVRQTKANAEKRGFSIEAYQVMWNELMRRFDPIFDFVYCRGNSLVYAASWEQNWIVPARSKEEIEIAVRNFYGVLKPRSYLYVDITSNGEKPHTDSLGILQTTQGQAEILWEIKHDTTNHVRTWTITLKFLKNGEERHYISYSYLLPPEELVSIFTRVGFSNVEQYVVVKGEKNYDVFLARK